MINYRLYHAAQIHLGAFDLEQDSHTIAGWTGDPAYHYDQGQLPARPLSPAQVRSQLEARERDSERYAFALRRNEDGRLIGIAEILRIKWASQNARLALALGRPIEQTRPYGAEAVALLTRYAFTELNLYQAGILAPAYNSTLAGWIEQAGFVLEIRQREALLHQDRRWDRWVYGQLQSEWLTRNSQERQV
jgi:RimJ/RimL family protein N-acetyltransferase